MALGFALGYAMASSTMEITLLAFAHARENFGFSSRTVSCDPEESPRALLARIAPGVDLRHVAVALDHEYVSWDSPLGQARELALIPPVSGG